MEAPYLLVVIGICALIAILLGLLMEAGYRIEGGTNREEGPWNS